MKTALTLTAAIALLALPGCAQNLLKSTEPMQTTYALRAVPMKSDSMAGTARIVEITKPEVPSGFERDRIALYLDRGHKLDYYASARWPAPFNDVMEEFTRRTMVNAMPSVVAVTPVQSLDAHYRLQTRVNDFQPVYEGSFSSAPLLVTSVEFTLIALPQETMVSSFTLNNSRQASSPRLDVIITEMEQQLQAIQSQAFEKLSPYLSGTKTRK